VKHLVLPFLLIVAVGCEPETLAKHLQSRGCTSTAPCRIIYTPDPGVGGEDLTVIDFDNSHLSHPDVLNEAGMRQAMVDGTCSEGCTAWLDAGMVQLRSSEDKPVVIGK